MSEHNDRKVLMSETLFMYLVKKAYPDDTVQVRWPGEPIVEITEFYEPVVTIAWRVPPEVIDAP